MTEKAFNKSLKTKFGAYKVAHRFLRLYGRLSANQK